MSYPYENKNIRVAFGNELIDMTISENEFLELKDKGVSIDLNKIIDEFNFRCYPKSKIIAIFMDEGYTYKQTIDFINKYEQAKSNH